jgi:hypothetical protein
MALRPWASFVGRWTVPILLDGRPSVISGELWHAGPPSIVWFWPIAVMLACVLAARRLGRPALDRWIARVLALLALAALVAGAVGQGLHGRPIVSIFQLVELGLILAFVLWGLWRVALPRPGFFSYFVIAIVALWQCLELIPTLVNGFVLIAVPALVARSASVLGAGAAAGLLLMVFRLYDDREEAPAKDARAEAFEEDDGTWELA